jgi:ABC-type Fe3+-citrate transport system substrate-binding protein
MKKILSVLFFIVAMFIVIACANTDANLKRETARSIGNLTPDEVTVSDVDRGMTNVDWKATTPNGNYKCSADDMLRRVNCVKR